ncbi:MAG: response regulator transcription factor [Gammaproteobacteria bacterium]|nr:response regulator transcription factor [Gammaproteobacteria bacterium]
MRLLLAEDDVDLVASLKTDLKKAGYAVDVADNGIDAEFLGKENIYDIAILDLGLPKKNGIEVLKNWREAGNLLPVIILTARNSWQQRVDGFKAGTDDYLGKPFHVEELLVRLNALIHRANKQVAGQKLIVSGFTLDEEKQTVTLSSGETKELTGIEFRLLRYFLSHVGDVLSKAKLTEHVYDFDSDKDSNVIEVYVRRLRQLLGHECIETRRGQGYIFKDKS